MDGLIRNNFKKIKYHYIRLMGIILIMILTGCSVGLKKEGRNIVNDSNKNNIIDENNQASVTGIAPKDGGNLNDSLITPDRNNSKAVQTKLGKGTFFVEKDIPEGRYHITGEGSGNLYIYDDIGNLYVNEILGNDLFGVDSVTTNLLDGDSIEITKLDSVTFTPADTIMYTDLLPTGIWDVGLDISPGKYDVTSLNGSGSFFVFDNKGLPITNEILGGELGVASVTVNLEAGYKVQVSGMDEVRLTAR